jgi:hypothetical protein
MGRDCAPERVPIALAEGRPEDPRAKALAEIDLRSRRVSRSEALRGLAFGRKGAFDSDPGRTAAD